MDSKGSRVIPAAALLLCVAGILAGIAMWGVATVRRAERTPSVAVQVAPAPRLQVDPERDLEAYMRDQQRLLKSVEWMDRDAGVVRIPVARATEQLLERGFPVRAPAESEEPK